MSRDRLPVRLTILLLAFVLGASAAAQTRPHPWRVLYSGTMNDAYFLLDLSLFDDGYAFARAFLPARGETLSGRGRIREDDLLELSFYARASGYYGLWEAEAARLDASEGGAPEPDATVASFTGTLSESFSSDGSSLRGFFVFGAEPDVPLYTQLGRIAQYATHSVSQGRIQALVTLPHFIPQSSDAVGYGDSVPARLNEFLEAGSLRYLREFVTEGRLQDADGILGWGWSQEEEISFEGAAGAYLSLLSQVYNYTGGAHGNTYFETYLLETAAAGITVLDLRDLFLSNGEWLDRLSELLLADLLGQEAQWVVDGEVAALTEADLAAFTLGPTGLRFYFAPYAMGPYVQGSFEVTLPFEAILGLARPDGALAAFAQGGP